MLATARRTPPNRVHLEPTTVPHALHMTGPSGERLLAVYTIARNPKRLYKHLINLLCSLNLTAQ